MHNVNVAIHCLIMNKVYVRKFLQIATYVCTYAFMSVTAKICGVNLVRSSEYSYGTQCLLETIGFLVICDNLHRPIGNDAT